MTETANISPSIPAQPRGIGGWLIVPVLVTCVSPLLTFHTVIGLLDAVTKPSFASYSQNLRAYFLGELLTNVVLIGGWLVATVMLFKRKAKYPKLFNGILLCTFVVFSADMAVAYGVFNSSPDASDIGNLIRSVLSCLIWIPYMLNSERVRNTFVN